MTAGTTVLPTTMPAASPFGDAKAAARALGLRAADAAAAIVVGGGGGAKGNGSNSNSGSTATRRNTASPPVAVSLAVVAGAAATATSDGNQPRNNSTPTPSPTTTTPAHLSPAERAAARRRVTREAASAYGSVLTWMSLSVLVIVFNKWLLAYSGFPFPLALTAWHMVACSAFGFAAVKGPLRLAPSLNLSSRDYCRRVLPVGALYAGSLWLSNSAYLHLSVSFIQMTKSLMPGLVYAFGVGFGTEKAKGSRAATMALIAAGVAVCALGEGSLSALGLSQQLCALGFEALRLTLVQVLMNARGCGMNALQSLFYVSPACLAFLLVPLFAVELPRYRALSHASAAIATAAHSVGGPAASAAAAAAASHALAAKGAVAAPLTALHFSAGALLANAGAALALNLAVFALVGRTSALTLNVAGVVKDWALIVFSWGVFGSPVTALTLGGYGLCCCGVAAYNAQKLKEMRARAAQEQHQRRGGGILVSGGGGGAGGGGGGGMARKD